jgi:hypothetical protein
MAKWRTSIGRYKPTWGLIRPSLGQQIIEKTDQGVGGANMEEIHAEDATVEVK